MATVDPHPSITPDGAVTATADPVAATADRVAELLTGGGGLSDPTRGDLVFAAEVTPRPLARAGAPGDCWAVDGGQALVADARTLQVVATRAATVRWRAGAMALESEGDLEAHLLGCGEERASLARTGAPVPPGSSVDVGLLRDWGEWRATAAAVEAADPGAVVLVDGDLQPDWRIPSSWLEALLARAADRGVTVAGVTKHSSLARGGAPLVGLLEQQAAAALSPRATWWAPVATTRPDVGAGLQVVVARLDPDAPYAFRVDLPAAADAEGELGRLSALCDDAAFPGYPYPLTVADRLAACGSWVRDELWRRLDDRWARTGLDEGVRDRAFSDRHRLMERA
ncbi:MAG TPA: DNA double-strand break repair nuclease NurA [Acidimicrobiales bacterium]|nr:DNA double-strand break repair nuclease NurA [Acidimicrobiales bacterium]